MIVFLRSYEIENINNRRKKNLPGQVGYEPESNDNEPTITFRLRIGELVWASSLLA